MQCTRCSTENRYSSNYCEHCGAPLRPVKRPPVLRKPIFLLAAMILLVCMGGYAYFSRSVLFPSPRTTLSDSPDRQEIQGIAGQESPRLYTTEAADERKDIPALMPVQTDTETSAAGPEIKKSVIAGWVTITDPWGRQVRKFRAGIAGNGWLALPARACLGGDSWHFYPDTGSAAGISAGIWSYGDRAGLWRIRDSAGAFEGQGIAPWNEREAVSWISLESTKKYPSLHLAGYRAEGPFRPSELPDYIDETGFFTQHDSVVGWSFGKWLKTAFMWAGAEEDELQTKILVRNFYDISFAHGREEKFASALAMQAGHDSLEQLASFIDGFRLQPRLSVEDTPYYLLPEEIIHDISALIAGALNRGEESGVVALLNSEALKNIGDIALLTDVLPVIASVRGYAAAIDEIEDTGRYLVRQQAREDPVLNALHVQLYQDWLEFLLSDRDVYRGFETYAAARDHYPDDPYIHLLGIELHLQQGDWRTAERLLYSRNYPPLFLDRYDVLALRISEMKGEEGKIIVRFPSGSSNIPVTASINEALYQDFLVDTGASMVTIPSATAAALKLKTQGGHHGEQRRVSTVGGVLSAREVIIDAIEIDGWVEYDVRALVIDIPDRPGLGLLGLNYLSRFQVDLKPEAGTLMLMPR